MVEWIVHDFYRIMVVWPNYGWVAVIIANWKVTKCEQSFNSQGKNVGLFQSELLIADIFFCISV
jgi:hypothetical protein